jgi:hypothetical protein
MMIDRRSFIQGALGVASAVPALSSTKPALRCDYSGPQHQTDSQAMDLNSILFKIDGWDRCDTATEIQLWIRINQSWRTAWR